jgi:cytochrome b-561
MIMIAAILAQLMRVYFTSAYRNPREINWFVGLGLFGISLFAAFTGYLLPYSNFSVTATSIGYYIAKSVPWIGNWISTLLFAGDFPSNATVPRFFFLHVMFIPAVLVSLIGLHMMILVKQKHTEPAVNRNKKEAQNGKRLIGIPIWPEQAIISIAFYFFLLFVIVLIATYIPLNPIETYGPPCSRDTGHEAGLVFPYCLRFPETHTRGSVVFDIRRKDHAGNYRGCYIPHGIDPRICIDPAP